MKILMMTNTYLPIVGGLEKSIQTFTEEFQRMGHQVRIVCPDFENAPEKEYGVIRVPSIQKFNKTDFSIGIPIPGVLESFVESYKPDVVHAHHPFLLGDLALRLCGQYDIPLVFTYHTMFEQYTNYFALNNESVQSFVISLAAGYANLADQVIVPSESIQKILEKRKVKRPIHVVPTGFDVSRFQKGDGIQARKKLDIPESAFVLGHVGRLSEEKNLGFLIEAVSVFLAQNPEAYFLVVGRGAAEEKMQKLFEACDLTKRVKFAGVLKDQPLVDAYHAMDLFAVASLSETQGMVTTEAMSAGIPAVGLDAAGIREAIKDGHNGYLVMQPYLALYVQALNKFYNLKSIEKEKLIQGAKKTAALFSAENCANRAIKVYEKAIEENHNPDADSMPWEGLMNRMKTEWDILENIKNATKEAIKEALGVD